jgi:hypothetical protein
MEVSTTACTTMDTRPAKIPKTNPIDSTGSDIVATSTPHETEQTQILTMGEETKPTPPQIPIRDAPPDNTEISNMKKHNSEAQGVFKQSNDKLHDILKAYYSKEGNQAFVEQIIPLIHQMGVANTRLSTGSDVLTTRASALQHELDISQKENIDRRGQTLKDMVNCLQVFAPEHEAELSKLQEHWPEQLNMSMDGFLRKLEPIITTASFRANVSKHVLHSIPGEQKQHATNMAAPCMGDMGASLALSNYNDLIKQANLQSETLFKQNPVMSNAAALSHTHNPHSTVPLGYLNSAQRGLTQGVQQTRASSQAAWPMKTDTKVESAFARTEPEVVNASARAHEAKPAFTGLLAPNDAWVTMMEQLPSIDSHVYHTPKNDDSRVTESVKRM